jgi:hypothetical protein
MHAVEFVLLPLTCWRDRAVSLLVVDIHIPRSKVQLYDCSEEVVFAHTVNVESRYDIQLRIEIFGAVSHVSPGTVYVKLHMQFVSQH